MGLAAFAEVACPCCRQWCADLPWTQNRLRLSAGASCRYYGSQGCSLVRRHPRAASWLATAPWMAGPARCGSMPRTHSQRSTALHVLGQNRCRRCWWQAAGSGESNPPELPGQPEHIRTEPAESCGQSTLRPSMRCESRSFLSRAAYCFRVLQNSVEADTTPARAVQRSDSASRLILRACALGQQRAGMHSQYM